MNTEVFAEQPPTAHYTLHCSTEVSHHYHHFGSHPSIILGWNHANQAFHRSARYGIWVLTIVLFLPIAAGGPTLLVVISPSHFTFAHVMLSTVLFSCTCMCSAFGLVAYFYCDDIVLAYNTMKDILGVLEKVPLTWKDPWNLEKLRKRWHIIRLLLKITVYVCVAMKWIIPGFLVFHNLDPLYSLQRFTKWLPHPVEVAGRLVSTQISFFVALQTYGLAVTSLFLWLEMQSRYFLHLKNMTKVTNHQIFFNWYAIFQIVVKIGKNPISEWIRIYMCSMFGVIVECNVMSIRNFGEVPLHIFWFIPSISVVNLVLCNIMLPYVTGCVEQTKKMITKKENLINAFNFNSALDRKFNKRKVKCFQPVSMHCGGTFPLKQHTKSQFLLTIVDRTLDGILI